MDIKSAEPLQVRATYRFASSSAERERATRRAGQGRAGQGDWTEGERNLGQKLNFRQTSAVGNSTRQISFNAQIDFPLWWAARERA